MAVSLYATFFNFIVIFITLSYATHETTSTPRTTVVIDPGTQSPVTGYDHIDIGCNYVNMGGIASPTDKCESMLYAGSLSSYQYKCNINNEYPSHTPVVFIFYYVPNCQDLTGTDSMVLDAPGQITDYVCSYDELNNDKCIDQQLTIKKYSHDAQSNITCIHDNNYVEYETQITNKCIKGSNVEYVKYECDGNVIYMDTYTDNQCSDISMITSDISIIDDECIEGQIVTFTCPTTTTPTTTLPKVYEHVDLGCNYVLQDVVAQPTDICLTNVWEGITVSHVYKCNENNEYNVPSPIVQILYMGNNCQDDTNPAIIEVTDIGDYVCSYNEQNNNKCINNRVNIKFFINQMNNDTKCMRNHDYIHSFTKITNKCVRSGSNEWIKCECDGNNFIINFYSDNQCITLNDGITYADGECDHGDIITHTCSGTTTNQPTTTTIITTPDPIECDYVNYDGFASRVDICHPSPHKGETLEFYALQCDYSNDTISGPIALNWWGAGGCYGEPLQTYPLSIGYDIIDYKCSESGVINRCPSSDVLILKIFEDEECYKSDESYRIVDMIVNKCTHDGNGGSQMVICDLNNNNMNEDMGYKITKYSDAYCNNMLTEERYSEVECKNGHLEFVVWCNGPNSIEYFDEKCEFHINNQKINNERKYLIHAVNKCSEFKLAGGYFSNQYICNSNNNGVTEIWYKGRRCQEHFQIGNWTFDANQNNFNCYQQTDNTISNDAQCATDDNLLTLRWYNKDPLTSAGDCIKKKGFYEDNYIITGICTPDFVDRNNGEMVYTMINCDENELRGFEIGFYSDPQCKSISRLNGIIFKSGQCFDGDIIDVIGCKGKGYEYSDYMEESFSSSDEIPVVV